LELEGIGRDEVGGEWRPMLSSSSLCLALLPISTLTLKTQSLGKALDPPIEQSISQSSMALSS